MATLPAWNVQEAKKHRKQICFQRCIAHKFGCLRFREDSEDQNSKAQKFGRLAGFPGSGLKSGLEIWDWGAANLHRVFERRLEPWIQSGGVLGRDKPPPPAGEP